jgi:hypothetical protein
MVTITYYQRFLSFTNEKVVLPQNSTQFVLHPAYFILHMLLAVDPGAETQNGCAACQAGRSLEEMCASWDNST